MDGYLRHLKKCNNFTTENKIAFVIDDKHVGWIRKEFIPYILESEFFVKKGNSLSFENSFMTFESRNRAMEQFGKKAYEDKISNNFMNESFTIRETPTSSPLCLVDRSVASIFGAIGFGQHLNGYVETETGLKMWIARRSYTKGFYAGKLDHIVAGGLPYGISLEENLYKECFEEANIKKELAQNAKSVGVVRYKHDYRLGGSEDILYCYDLSLPKDFVPRCNDNEVEEFYLMDVEEVAEIVKTSDAFKCNCNLVIIDFLVRHGYIKPEDKNYLEIVSRLS
jgi:isopentenyldiphosphate isomerase